MADVSSPTRAEFFATAIDAFAFLQRFNCQGGVEDDVDPFKITFSTTHCAVDVMGINWGYELAVDIRSLDYDRNTTPYEGIYPLWALLQFRNTELYDVRYLHTSGQLKMIRMDAASVEMYASDLLSGDFRIRSKMAAFLRQNAKAVQRRSHQEIEDQNYSMAAKNAEAAFRKKKYDEAASELGKFEARLTRSQKMKLEYARNWLARNGSSFFRK